MIQPTPELVQQALDLLGRAVDPNPNLQTRMPTSTRVMAAASILEFAAATQSEFEPEVPLLRPGVEGYPHPVRTSGRRRKEAPQPPNPSQLVERCPLFEQHLERVSERVHVKMNMTAVLADYECGVHHAHDLTVGKGEVVAWGWVLGRM